MINVNYVGQQLVIHIPQFTKGVTMNNAEQVFPVISLALVIFIVFMFLAAVVVSILLWCKILSKTGNSWLLGLIILVPFGNLILLLILAFNDWPVLKELRHLKGQR